MFCVPPSFVLTKQPVTSCELSRLDYCNSLLMGTPNSVIQPMQKVQNNAARLILRAPRHQNYTPLLQQLHWLPISERIKYKTACMCYNAVTGSAPSYFSELLHLYSPSRSFRSSSDTRMLKIQRFNRKTHGFRTFALSHTFLTLWPPHLEQSPPRHQALCYSLFLQKLTQDISLLRIFQLNYIVLHSHQSVQCACVRACVRACARARACGCVCVCVCVCVCIFCIIMLEHLSIYTFLFFFITFSISMYIMCVCLFSALSRRVGALQISIIIIIINIIIIK